ncbi:tetratricopeptide repeat protein [Mucilaginibacter terrae]|uniref:Tetratricopeptide (TPR) repeat protein n=1 Tax=Mucilaginibacter terrae TaxID=1955052 RepID=A0ABU3GQ57_9SPHI|nr:tetratricopeptide repeat protein [Mucilaginibacter terrae]MDT3401919.1 tetratricopeptide (TPR) repeat protein [Mucilaginibacter terrae]
MFPNWLRLIGLLPILLLITAATSAQSNLPYNKLLDQVDEITFRHPDSALVILKKIHAESLNNNDVTTAGISLQRMGQICYNQGHYAQALDFYLHADKLFGQQKNKDLLAGNLAKMGILYYYNKQLDKSRSLYKRALSIYRSSNNLKGQAEVYGNMGHLFEKRKLYDSAFYYQHLALARYNQVSLKQGAAKIYENLGSIYEDLAKYDSAYTCFTKSKQLYDQDDNTIASIEVINNIGDVLRKTGRYAESIIQSRKAYNLSLQTNNLYQLAASSRDLGKSYQLLRQMDSAYHYIELSRRYSLDVYSKEALNQTAFLQVLYDIDKKSDEIARLNAIRKTNRIIAAAVITVSALLIIIAIVIFSRQRLKLRDQKILADQNRSIYEAQKELMQLELKNKNLEEDSLKQQLELKSRELSTHTLNLIKNNQLLEGMRNTLQEMVKDDKRDQKKQMQQIIQQINQSFSHEQHWKEFTTAFEQVHQSFFDNLKQHSNDLTSTDIKLIALLKVNMESKDIAGLLGISMDSLRVARYRLRKKLNLEQGDNLSSFIQGL